MRLLKWVGIVLGVFGSSVGTTYGQKRLYLDAQVGAWYGYSEEAYLHRGRMPRPVYASTFGKGYWVSPQARLVLNSRWSAAAGVALGDLTGWGHKLTVPPEATHNPNGGENNAYYYAPFSVNLPLSVFRTIWRRNTAGLGQQQHTHAWGIGVDVTGNLVPAWHRREMGFPNLQIGGLYDTAYIMQNPYVKRQWGLRLGVGLTTRVYRLDKERFNITLQVQQGLWDVIEVPFSYYYNRRSGTGLQHVRGSGISLTLGYPILVKTFAAR